MGCTAGRSNSVHEPAPEVLHGQQKPVDFVDFIDLRKSKSMMAEDPQFRSMFEGVGVPVLYQPHLGFGFGRSWTHCI